MFTPGPWNYANRGDFCMVTGTRAEDPEPDGRTIAEIRNTDTEAEGDARLIAAAPELLAVLETLCDRATGNSSGSVTIGAEHIKHIRALVAKATLPR